ncbi:MAG: flippase-like domain-containing protein [Oligoflexia bacterium]|nr:flippase-like domain-containing protein [Oligoflexia bacterium]
MTLKFVKYALAIAALATLCFLADIRELWATLSQLTPWSLSYLMLVSALLIYISALKWGLFLEHLGDRVAIAHLFGLYLIGYFVNLLMPSYLGGDVVRSYYVGKKVGQHEAAAATILERYTGLVAMLVLAAATMWFVSLVTLEIKLAVLIIGAGLVVLTYCALADWPLRRMESVRFLVPIVKSLRKIQEGFRLVKGAPALLGKAMLLSFLYHTFTVLNTAAAGWVVGWETAPLGDLFVVLPIILLVGAVPLTPQGLGLQEGAFFFFLQGVGATPAQALGVALVLRAKSYILALLGAGLFVRQRKSVG